MRDGEREVERENRKRRNTTGEKTEKKGYREKVRDKEGKRPTMRQI